MTTPVPGGTPAAPKWKPLDARQRRVLGVLIEKAKTTPAAYPMTVNAIVTGCNQKNNRDPLTQYDNIDVEKALDELRQLGVVSEIDWMGRVSKYKHHAYEWLGVGRVEMAVMTELLLRGAQQLGELRGRAARMEDIADLSALKPIVEGLIEKKLMLELTPSGRGQVVSHHLYLPSELAEVRTLAGSRAVSADDEVPTIRSSMPASPPPAASSDQAHVLSELRAEVAGLRAEIARLNDSTANLRARLDVLERREG